MTKTKNSHDVKKEVEAKKATERSQKFPCTLRVSKPDFSGKSTWDCYFNKIISVKIKDAEFLQKVKEGLLVSCKTELEVEMEMTNKKDEKGKTVEGTEVYNVWKVLRVINI